MANRRCLQALTRHYTSIISPSSSSLQYLKILNPQLQALALINPSQILSPKFHHISTHIRSNCYTQFTIARHFSSNQRYDKDNEEEDEDDDEDDDEEEIDDSNDDENVSASNSSVEREYSPEEKENEAAAIGYKVIGPLQRSDRIFKDYELVLLLFRLAHTSLRVYTWRFIRRDEATDQAGSSSTPPKLPGGLICSSGVHVEEMGDKNGECYIVNAAVYVGY